MGQEMNSILKRPKVRVELLIHGLTPQACLQAELRQFIESDSTHWGKLIRERSIGSV